METERTAKSAARRQSLCAAIILQANGPWFRECIRPKSGLVDPRSSCRRSSLGFRNDSHAPASRAKPPEPELSIRALPPCVRHTPRRRRAQDHVRLPQRVQIPVNSNWRQDEIDFNAPGVHGPGCGSISPATGFQSAQDNFKGRRHGSRLHASRHGQQARKAVRFSR